MERLTATDVSRQFSEVLNRVSAGQEVEVTRSGAPVAVIRPVRDQVISASQFRALIESAPPLDDDFAGDVARLRESVGPPPQLWPS